MLIGGAPEMSVMNVELSGSQIRYREGGGGRCELLPKCPHWRKVLMNTQKKRKKKSCVNVEAGGVCDWPGFHHWLHRFPLPPAICSSGYGSSGHMMHLHLAADRRSIAIMKTSCFSNSLCQDLHGFTGLLYNCLLNPVFFFTFTPI